MPVPPSDLIWKPFIPLLEQVASLHGVLDVCTLYVPWCVAAALGLATLILAGIILAHRSSRDVSSQSVSLKGKGTVPA